MDREFIDRRFDRLLDDAHELRRQNKTANDHINDLVCDQLKQIRTAIRDSHAEFVCQISFALPLTIDVPSLANNEAQLEVYTRVMWALEARHYDISVSEENGSFVLHVSWERETQTTSRTGKLAYLRARMTKG